MTHQDTINFILARSYMWADFLEDGLISLHLASSVLVPLLVTLISISLSPQNTEIGKILTRHFHPFSSCILLDFIIFTLKERRENAAQV